MNQGIKIDRSFLKKLLWLACALLLIALCVALLLHFSGSLQDSVTKQLSTQFAEEINAHMVAGIESTTLSLSYECQAINKALLHEDNLTLDHLYAFINDMQSSDNLSYIGFLDVDGFLYDHEGDSLGMTRIGIVAELLNGREQVLSDNETIHQNSYIMYGMRLDETLNAEGREIFAIIIGITNDDMSRRLMLSSDYSHSYASIIQKDGYFIVKNEQESEAGLNEYSILRSACGVSEEALAEAKTGIEAGEFTLLSAVSESMGRCYVCFTNVPDSDWVLVSHIPESYVLKSVSSMRSTLNAICYGIIIVITLICAVTLLTLNKSNQKLEQSRRQLDEALVAANNANIAKTRFLNNMSHDIRTPMNAIIGMLNILRHQTQDPQVLKSVDKIDISASYLLSLINDVLDISRIESGKMKLDPQPVELARISSDVEEIIRNHLTNRKIEFTVEQKGSAQGLVLADTLRIQEILLNILNNAVKFTPDGGTIRFLTAVEPGADDAHVLVHYTIADSGIGMSEEFQKTIFEEFTQESKGARTQYKGTGLGMSIVKKLVDMMGGTVSVQSKQGEGSTFFVMLPMEVTQQQIETEREEDTVCVSTQGLHVMLAEDNDLNAEIAEFMLDSNGITMDRACNGLEAVELFQSHPAGTYDLILMDVMMPEMNGYDATRAIRAMANRSDAKIIPIIAMTANAFTEDAQEALEAGLNAHLSKPVDEDKLLRCIAKYVGRARQDRA